MSTSAVAGMQLAALCSGRLVDHCLPPDCDMADPNTVVFSTNGIEDPDRSFSETPSEVRNDNFKTRILSDRPWGPLWLRHIQDIECRSDKPVLT